MALYEKRRSPAKWSKAFKASTVPKNFSGSVVGDGGDGARRYDGNFDEIVFFDLDSIATSLVAESDGTVYAGLDNGKVQKVSPQNSVLWTYNFNHTQEINSLDLDSSGNLIGGSDNQDVFKIASDGTLSWTYTGFADVVNGVAVGPNDEVFACAEDSTVRKLDSTGTEQWQYTTETNDNVELIATSSGDVVYAYGVSFAYATKLTSSGNKDWNVQPISSGAQDITIDQNDDLYICGGEYIKKLNPSDGSTLWSNQYSGDVVRAVDVEEQKQQVILIADFDLSRLDYSGNKLKTKGVLITKESELTTYRVLRI